MSLPTEWTYGGQLEWTSESLRMAPVDMLLKCIIESIKERDATQNILNQQYYHYPLPALLTATYNPLRPLTDYLVAIQSAIDHFFPYYVDPSYGWQYPFVNDIIDASGYDGIDYTGIDYPLPVHFWDEASSITAIGDAARIPTPSAIGSDLVTWLIQQYKILNLLKWTMPYHNATSGGCYLDFTWSNGSIPTIIYLTNFLVSPYKYRQWFSGNITYSGNTKIFTPWPYGYGYTGSEFKSILKFDGAGGFRFKDW